MSITGYPAKMEDGFYHVYVDGGEIGKYKTKKKAIEKCEATPESVILLDDGTQVYPDETEDTVAAPEPEASSDEQPVEEEKGACDPLLYGIVKTRLNVRVEPSMESDIVTTLRRDSLVDIVEDCGDWYGIPAGSPAKNGEAYINASFVKTGHYKYTVAVGDSLASIADTYGTTAKEIKDLNGLKFNRLRIGSIIILP